MFESGVLGAPFIGLLPWRDALEDFDRDVYSPARKAADEHCRKAAGY